MANNNNIKRFTSADIEKYHKGQLSDKERHDLEKAALDDPFLADALEGFAFAGGNASADLAELKQRLNEKIEGGRVIPLEKRRRRVLPVLKVAAAVVVFVGAGLLVYQLQLGKNKNNIAQAKPADTNKISKPDSSTGIIAPTGTTTENNNFLSTDSNKETTGREVTGNVTKTTTIAPGREVSTEENKNDADVLARLPKPVTTTAPVVTPTEKAAEEKTNLASGKGYEKDISKEGAKDKVVRADKLEDNVKDRAGKQTDDFKKIKSEQPDRSVDEQFYRNQAMNTFRGRVTDPSRIGVPFANVTNTRDNVGTYTDALGNFTLTSTDSVLNVQVRSVGFENNMKQLRNTTPADNEVVLQEDRKNIDERVVSYQKPNATARTSQAKVTLTEPEPEPGWDKYDSYLANNVIIPDDFKPVKTETNSVQVSFEVDKNGEPVNFKVEKSLCSSCDKEAIRLIKAGPKWKRNANKKGRTTVTINF